MKPITCAKSGLIFKNGSLKLFRNELPTFIPIFPLCNERPFNPLKNKFPNDGNPSRPLVPTPFPKPPKFNAPPSIILCIRSILNRTSLAPLIMGPNIFAAAGLKSVAPLVSDAIAELILFKAFSPSFACFWLNSLMKVLAFSLNSVIFCPMALKATTKALPMFRTRSCTAGSFHTCFTKSAMALPTKTNGPTNTVRTAFSFPKISTDSLPAEFPILMLLIAFISL